MRADITEKEQKEQHTAYRRKRVRRLKRIILSVVLAAIVIPVIACCYLLYRVQDLEKQLQEISERAESMTPEVYTTKQAEQDQTEDQTEGQPAKQNQTEEQVKHRVYLTFDDGPTAYTEEILDILDRYQVKATFFVTGEEAVSHPQRYTEIVKRGHTIGMHSYSHQYGEIYESVENFSKDLKKLQDFLYDTTGVKSTLYRFPGGSSNTVSKVPMQEFCDYLDENNITYFDWNISSKDARNPMLSSEEICNNCIEDIQSHEDSVILLHDSVKKRSTVEALPSIIEAVSDMPQTKMLAITEDTVIIQHKRHE